MSTDAINPLGLNLDFLFGRGYLWARQEPLTDWISLEHLRMEIPDLKFPFDARGGLNRFRNTRCLVREIELASSEVGVGDLLRQASEEIDGYTDIDLHFLDGAAHVSMRVSSLGANTFLSFRCALIPPEPARADEVHLSFYDYRSFGPLPFPARLLVFDFVTRLLNTPALRPPGRGGSFTVGIAGDILRLRPLKLMLLNIFPKVGWKLPNLSDVVLEAAVVRPGLMTLRAVSHEPGWTQGGHSMELQATTEGARALAAYEAKDLFAHGDQALFDRQVRQAMELYAGYRDVYGPNPELVGRMLDVLLSEPSPSNLAQAESLVRELESENPKDLRALFARPTIALVSGKREDAVQHFETLALELQRRGDIHDWVLCELATAHFLRSHDPDAAAQKLREVLKISPRNQIALEALRSIYEELGEAAGLEEVLKRLTGVYTDRDSLTQTYLTLARHLMDRQGEVGEARIYLERVLRLDPTQLDALDTLGESYVMSGEPLRALRAFGSAARSAESRQQVKDASRLHFRVAKLWFSEVSDIGQALLSCRRALSLSVGVGGFPIEDRLEQLVFAAELCEERERYDEAIGYWADVVPELERLVDAGAQDQVSALVQAHRRLSSIYDRRGRPDAAATHLRRLVELDPEDESSIKALEAHYQMSGKPEALIELYRGILTRGTLRPNRELLVRVRLGEVYEVLNLPDDAAQQLVFALKMDPSSEPARRALIRVYLAAGKAKTLRSSLNGVLLRVNEKSTRWGVLMDLGDVQLERLDEPAEAAKAYLEALSIQPAKFEALFRAGRALEMFVEQSGVDAKAPGGQTTAGRWYDQILNRIAEVRTQDHERVLVFQQMESVRNAMGDSIGAREAARRAQAITGEQARDVRHVDERIDELLGESPIRPIPDEKTNPSMAAADAFRKEFEEDAKKPHRIPKFDEIPPTTVMGKILGKEAVSEDLEDGFERKKTLSGGFDTTAKAQALTSFDSADRDKTSVSKSRLMESTELALRSDDLQGQVRALRSVLEAANSREISLAPSQRLEWSRILGELLYYDLEEPEESQPYLEYVRDESPNGAKPSVLNALESIYEDRGELEGRIAILQERLGSAESEEMETVFRLLIAQLMWEHTRDSAQVMVWLSPILQKDSRHEAAHRLLAEVASESGEWADAAEHLRNVLEVSAGGLDAVEVERELADILLTKMDEPRPAVKHLKNVLTAAPGDSRALESLRQAYAQLENWEAFATTLCVELGLLLAKPKMQLADVGALKVSEVSTPIRMAASQIVADLAEVVQTELGGRRSARDLWGVVHQLWPEHVEALERRIDLDRNLDEHADLAADLEAYADLLLDPRERFATLAEAARLQGKLGQKDAARNLYTQALAIVESEPEPPKNVDEVRRALQSLERE